MQVASLAEIGRESSAIILVFDQHKPDKATAVALLPDGRRFINRALRLDPIEEGQKWDAPASKAHYVFDEDSIDDDGSLQEDPHYNYGVVEARESSKSYGTWYFIGVGEDGKAWQELKANGYLSYNNARHVLYKSKLVDEQVSHFIDDIKVGQEIRVFHNQAYRYGQVVARIGSEILGVFTLRNGKNVLAVWGFNKVAAYPINLIIPAALRNPIESHPKYEFLRTVSFNSIPKKWVDELAKLGADIWHREGSGPVVILDAEQIINFLEEEFSGEDNTI